MHKKNPTPASLFALGDRDYLVSKYFGPKNGKRLEEWSEMAIAPEV